MLTLNYILEKFNLKYSEGEKLPMEIPNFGRNQLAVLLAELNFKIGVEVGVAGGDYSRVLCEANPQMHIYGIDPFVPYKGYRDYVRQSTLDGLEHKAKRQLRHFANYTFEKKFSMDAVKDFADNSIDFAYLDGNHENPFVTQDVTEWYKKIRPGGILAGHDYARTKRADGTPLKCDVKDAVLAFTKKNNITPWFVLGAEATDQGLIRDKPRSWLIIKF